MRVTTILRAVALATVVTTASLAGLAGVHPTKVGAWSCPLEYLASAPVYRGTDQQATEYLIKNDCDGKIFARISTPVWFADVYTGLFDGNTVVAQLDPNLAYLAWGGHRDTPEITPVRGHTYSAYGAMSNGYVGQTAAWTAP